MKSDLKVLIREPGYVSPFINGSNIWTLEEKEWTYDVRKAILHAYEVGHRHAIDKLLKDLDAEYRGFPIGTKFPPPEMEKQRREE